jgi:hypothetical protein
MAASNLAHSPTQPIHDSTADVPVTTPGIDDGQVGLAGRQPAPPSTIRDLRFWLVFAGISFAILVTALEMVRCCPVHSHSSLTFPLCT